MINLSIKKSWATLYLFFYIQGLGLNPWFHLLYVTNNSIMSFKTLRHFFEEEAYRPFPKCRPLRRLRCPRGLGLELVLAVNSFEECYNIFSWNNSVGFDKVKGMACFDYHCLLCIYTSNAEKTAIYKQSEMSLCLKGPNF